MATINQNDGNASRPFVDYYNKIGVTPVAQDLSLMEAFTDKRLFLYQSLGIAPILLKGSTIIEFGHGGGYNAAALATCGPQQITFVDAAEPSNQELSRRVKAGCFINSEVEIVKEDIFDYQTDNRYDLAIIEGVIPGQTYPTEMLRHVAGFVEKGGLLVMTTTSSVSLLSEVCRRIMRIRIFQDHIEFDHRLSHAERVFSEHLQAFGISTRPIRHWVLDQIFHDFPEGSLIYTLEDAVNALAPQFKVHGSLPRFFADGRWHKQYEKQIDDTNAAVIEQYRRKAVALIDYRVEFGAISQSNVDSSELERWCSKIYHLHIEMLRDNNYEKLNEFCDSLLKVKETLPRSMSQTRDSIQEFLDLVYPYSNGREIRFKKFKNWWGRGQQYISFIRMT